jgi:hypothetical protein
LSSAQDALSVSDIHHCVSMHDGFRETLNPSGMFDARGGFGEA